MYIITIFVNELDRPFGNTQRYDNNNKNMCILYCFNVLVDEYCRVMIIMRGYQITFAQIKYKVYTGESAQQHSFIARLKKQL